MGTDLLTPAVESPATTDTDPWDEVRAALDEITHLAHLTSGIPAPVIKALRSPEPVVVSVTCYGAPITLSTDAGPMAYEYLKFAWAEVQAQTPPPGVHVHVTADGEARVDTILYTHKSRARGGAA